MTVTPHRDVKGNIIGAIAVSIDITELKRTERMLRDREAYLNLLMSQIPAIIWTTDENLTYTWFYGGKSSRSLAEYQKYLLGKSINSLYDENNPEDMKVVDAHRSAFAGIANHYERTLKDGSMFDAWVEPLHNEKGDIIGTIGIAIDITEKKKMEMQLLAKNRELDNFAFRVSHDLKSPLIIAGGYLTIMLEEADNCQEYANILYTHIQKVVNLVDSLLNLARAGLSIEKSQDVDLTAIVENAYLSLGGKHVPIELNLSKLLPCIKGDPDRLTMLFTILLYNAIQFRDPAKEMLTIDVNCIQEQGSILISVTDNGLGIKPDLLEKIFEYGYSTDPYKKSGFGLATGRRIVEAHGGEIWAESAGPGQGATIHIQLPIDMGMENEKPENQV